MNYLLNLMVNCVLFSDDKITSYTHRSAALPQVLPRCLAEVTVKTELQVKGTAAEERCKGQRANLVRFTRVL